MSQSPCQLAIVMVNYKIALVLAALASLKADLLPQSVEVVVVDNHSQDGSAGHISSWIKDNQLDDRIHLIAATHNSGFSAGNSQTLVEPDVR